MQRNSERARRWVAYGIACVFLAGCSAPTLENEGASTFSQMPGVAQDLDGTEDSRRLSEGVEDTGDTFEVEGDGYGGKDEPTSGVEDVSLDTSADISSDPDVAGGGVFGGGADGSSGTSGEDTSDGAEGSDDDCAEGEACIEECEECGLDQVCSAEGNCVWVCEQCPAPAACFDSPLEEQKEAWELDGASLTGTFFDVEPEWGPSFLVLTTGVLEWGNYGSKPGVNTADIEVCLPAQSHTLTMEMRVFSEEFVEWCGLEFQDTFEVQVWNDSGMWETLASYTVDSLCPPGACEGCGDAYVGLVKVDYQLDYDDVHGTPWFSVSVPIPAGTSEGAQKIRFQTKSAFDLSHTTVVLLDQIQLTACVPECGEAECGDDGCGGTCGGCGDGELCTSEGSCCEPDCVGKECGPDGCGASCGSCDDMSMCQEGLCQESCGDGWCQMDQGEDCESCPQDCDKDTCPELICPPGYVTSCVESCLPKTWLGDGYCDAELQCEEAEWDKGDCSEGCMPDCAGKECGSDGCGGTCGSCPPESSCEAGVCGECIPECGDKECGFDGCGGVCGMCEESYEVCGFNGKCGQAGCTGWPMGGCNGCSCEACVCDTKPKCCEGYWDASCVAICVEDCGGCGLIVGEPDLSP